MGIYHGETPEPARPLGQEGETEAEKGEDSRHISPSCAPRENGVLGACGRPGRPAERVRGDDGCRGSGHSPQLPFKTQTPILPARSAAGLRPPAPYGSLTVSLTGLLCQTWLAGITLRLPSTTCKTLNPQAAGGVQPRACVPERRALSTLSRRPAPWGERPVLPEAPRPGVPPGWPAPPHTRPPCQISSTISS